jgi:hypothetical protein
MLAEQIEKDSPKVEVQYTRVVEKCGNIVACKLIDEVLEYRMTNGEDSVQFGKRMQIKKKYSAFNAENELRQEVPVSAEPKGCICARYSGDLRRLPTAGYSGKNAGPRIRLALAWYHRKEYAQHITGTGHEKKRG